MNMQPRVLFVPTWLISPDACEALPAIRSALEDLRKRFTVDVFAWPWVAGGKSSANGLSGTAEQLRASMSQDCHVVTMGSGTVNLLIALDGNEELAASLTCAGFSVPPATLRSLDRPSVASGASAMFRWKSSYQYVRLVMPGADEEVWTEAAKVLDRDVDWQRAGVTLQEMEECDLEVSGPRVSAIPALYLDSPLSVAGFAEMTEIFLRYVPQAKVEELAAWPGRMQDSETGRDLSRKVIAFIEAVEAG